MNKDHLRIIEHYEKCLDKHGDNHLGMDWPNLDDVHKRYQIMLDIIRFQKGKKAVTTLLDFGCGTAHLLEFMEANNYDDITYTGLDISQKSIDIAVSKYPEVNFYCMDILNGTLDLKNFDFIVMNGVFTEKRDLSFEDMWTYFTVLIKAVFEKCDKGIAFNVMSKSVDWERTDLFHVSLEKMSEFLCNDITRNFVVRNDYGLYEYTVYILKK